MSEVSILVDGNEYLGWTEVTIKRSLEQAAGTFTLAVSDGRSRPLATYPIQRESECVVLVDGQAVINGVVEKLDARIDENNRSLSISGRDVTRDMIDCSAIIPNQELKDITLKAAAELLLAPYGIEVNCDSGQTFKKIAVNDGETAFSVIERYARQLGLMCYTLGDRVLHITKPSPTILDFTLSEGVNIKSASATHDSSQLHGEYIVKTQAKGGKHAVKASAVGTGGSQRKLIVRAEKSETDPLIRAEWESQVREARSRRATVTVRGWQVLDQLWMPNLSVWLDSPSLGFDQAMLVAGVSLSLNDSAGELATLELVAPETYAREP